GKDDIIYLNGDLVCDHAVIRDIIASKRDNATALSRNEWDKEQVKICINRDRSIKALGKWIGPEDSYGEFVGATKISKEFGKALRKILEQLQSEGLLAQKFAADTLHEAISLSSSDKMYILDVSDYKTIEIDTLSDFHLAD